MSVLVVSQVLLLLFFFLAEKLEIIQFFGFCCWLQLLLQLLLFSLFDGDDGGE